MLNIKQTNALTPESIFSKAIVKTADLQSSAPSASEQQSAPKTEKVNQAQAQQSSDPLARADKKSMFKTPAHLNSSVNASAPAQSEPAKVEQSTVSNEKQLTVESHQESAQKTNAPVKRTLKNITDKTKAAKAEGFDRKIVLHTFKVFEPAISAAVFSHGSVSAADTRKAIQVITDQSEALTKELCKIADVNFVDENMQWVVSNLRLIAMTHVSSAYKRNPDPDNFTCDHFSDAFSAVSEAFSVAPEKSEFPDMNDSLRIKLSIMKSLTPVIKEYGLFENVLSGMVGNFKINRAVIFDQASRLLQEKSMEFVRLAGVEQGESGELIAYQSMLNVAGVVMSNCIATACDHMLDHLDGLNAELRQKFVQSQISSGNHAVIDLSLMEDEFYETMLALNDIVKNSPLLYATSVSNVKPRM